MVKVRAIDVPCTRRILLIPIARRRVLIAVLEPVEVVVIQDAALEEIDPVQIAGLRLKGREAAVEVRHLAVE